MKILNLVLIIGLGASLIGCKPESTVPIGEPGSKLEGIDATWSIVAVQIVDNNTINGDSISLTNYYTDGEVPTIAFDSETKQYSVSDGGKRNFFGTSGTWEFDDPDYPTLINLTTDEGVQRTLTLTSTVRPQDPRLRVNFERQCDDKAYATYYFEYTRQ